MATIDLYGTPMDTATDTALAPAEKRAGDVHIVISRDEHSAHWNADANYDNGVDTDAVLDALGNLWTPATDQLTGIKVLITRAACGGGCRCAMAVKLA